MLHRYVHHGTRVGRITASLVFLVLGVLLLIVTVIVLVQTVDRKASDSPPLSSKDSHLAGPPIPVLEVPEPTRLPAEHSAIANPWSASDLGTTFIVMDDREERPLQGIQVFLDYSSSRYLLGTSDSTGRVKATIPKISEYTFRAFGSNYEPAIQYYRGTVPDEVPLRLHSGGVIRGRVQTHDGKSAGAGVHIAAWPLNETRHSQGIDTWYEQGVAPFANAISNSLGEFELTGILRSQRYFVTAGANGLLAEDQVADCDAIDVVLTLVPIFGIVINIRGGDGETPEFLTSQGPNFGIAFSHALSLGHHVYENDLRLLLAGVNLEKLPISSPVDRVFFLIARSDNLELGPIRLSSHYPGYSKVQVDLFLTRVSEGIQEHVVTLRQSASSWGELTVLATGVPTQYAPDHSRQTPVASLQIVDESDQRFRYDVYDFSKPIVVGKLPHGTYSYQFKLKAGLSAKTPMDGTLRHYSPDSRISLDLSDVGIVVAEILTAEGVPYLGRAEFAVASKGGTASATYYFSNYPYVLEGLPSGEYQVSLAYPIPESGDFLHLGSFVVGARELTNIKVEGDL